MNTSFWLELASGNHQRKIMNRTDAQMIEQLKSQLQASEQLVRELRAELVTAYEDIMDARFESGHLP